MLVELGTDSFFQGTIADITEYVETKAKQQKQLKQAVQKAKAANQAKSAFLFKLSHDVCAPMKGLWALPL